VFRGVSLTGSRTPQPASEVRDDARRSCSPASRSGWVSRCCSPQLRWFARRPLTERLWHRTCQVARASVAGSASSPWRRSGRRSGRSRAGLGSRFSRLFGISEELEVRLRRIHAPLDVTGFRVRQIGWSLGGLGAGALLTIVVVPPVAVGLLLTLGGMLLAFLVLEHQVEQPPPTGGNGTSERSCRSSQSRSGCCSAPATRSRVRWSGSPGGAAAPSPATCSACRAASARGLSVEQALREWAELAGVASVDRLVAVLATDREAGDIGRLIAGGGPSDTTRRAPRAARDARSPQPSRCGSPSPSRRCSRGSSSSPCRSPGRSVAS
jgi:tight adherence protein C